MGANTSKIRELEHRIVILENSTRDTEYAQLQERYDALHARHEELLSERTRGNATSTTATTDRASINLAAIDNFVDNILADPNANIYYLPDVAERGLYTNVLKMCLLLLQKSVADLKINFVGHELHVQMTPNVSNDEILPSARQPAQ